MKQEFEDLISQLRTNAKNLFEQQTNFNAIGTEPILTENFNSSRSLTNTDEIIITDEFKQALYLLESTSESLFITGKAGTGKSTLLQLFRQSTEKNVVILAPTGVSALNIGGQTIHSFFRFPLRLMNDAKIFRDKKRKKMFQKIDMIIIDEISMVRADIIDAIDHSLRLNREVYTLPFGGVQMVFFGDLFQLPPVVESEELKMHFSLNYDSPYFFSANSLIDFNLTKIELTKIFRQKDTEFIQILNNIRDNTITNNLLFSLNSRCLHNNFNKDIAIYLTSTNKIATEINKKKLNEISSQEFNFEAVLKGNFSKDSFPTDENLLLKKNAQIMMLKNDPDKRWVNGTLGIITDITPLTISVKINSKIYSIEKVKWDKIEYDFDTSTRKITESLIGSFTQFPLKLAWAVTIHKSQGKTFDNVVIDLGAGAFAHGQTYVALSRCRSIDGVKLVRPLKLKDIIVDEKVLKFHL